MSVFGRRAEYAQTLVAKAVAVAGLRWMPGVALAV